MSTTISRVVTGTPAVSRQDVYDRMRFDVLGSPPTHPLDSEIDLAIAAATEFAESLTRRSILECSCTLSLSEFPDSGSDQFGIELPMGPVQSVTDVRYADSQNVMTVVDSAEYFFATEANPQRLYGVLGRWPVVCTSQRADAVQVRYTAGYSQENDSPMLGAVIPASVKQAILIGVQLIMDELAVDKRNALEALRHNILRGYRVDTF